MASLRAAFHGIHLGPQRLDLGLKRFILRDLPPQKLRRQLRLLSHPGWREQIGVAQLVLALTEVLHLDPAFFHQGLGAEIDAAQTDAQFPSQAALIDFRRLMQTAQHFELSFLLETSQLLKWGYEAQGDLGTLPPCRFTISKRGQRGLTVESGGVKRGKKLPLVRQTNEIVPPLMILRKVFCQTGNKTDKSVSWPCAK